MPNNSATGRRALLDLMLDGKSRSVRELADLAANGNVRTIQSYVSDLRGIGISIEGEMFYTIKKKIAPRPVKKGKGT